MMREKLTFIEQKHSIRIDHVEWLSSTNDAASEAGRQHGDVIWAEIQTKGRGQRGNSWNSSGGKNLTFSVVLVSDLLVEFQFYLSKIISIALVEALSEFGLTAEIKWPNDIYIGDRKIAGILIENDLLGTRVCKSIVGVGLNVNQQQFPPELPNPTSMTKAAGVPFERLEVLSIVLDRLFYWYNILKEDNFKKIDAAYGRFLYRRKGAHLFQEPEGIPFKALIQAVLPSGELVLQPENGTAKSYLFKEIEFIIG